MKYDEEHINKLRQIYKPGTKIKLISMNEEPYPVKSGEIGIVDHVDDAGHIQMKWDHSTLALIPEVDDFEIIEEVK